jgi:hypothetical protein
MTYEYFDVMVTEMFRSGRHCRLIHQGPVSIAPAKAPDWVAPSLELWGQDILSGLSK